MPNNILGTEGSLHLLINCRKVQMNLLELGQNTTDVEVSQHVDRWEQAVTTAPLK